MLVQTWITLGHFGYWYELPPRGTDLVVVLLATILISKGQ